MPAEVLGIRVEVRGRQRAVPVQLLEPDEAPPGRPLDLAFGRPAVAVTSADGVPIRRQRSDLHSGTSDILKYSQSAVAGTVGEGCVLTRCARRSTDGGGRAER